MTQLAPSEVTIPRRSMRGVMHLTDTLDLGGLEHVAVNLANLLPSQCYRRHLCTTRRDGPLANLVHADVGRLCLHRKHTLDLAAMRRLRTYLQQHDIRLLHAHGTTLLVASLAARFPPYPAVVWHVHAGSHAIENSTQTARIYRLLLQGSRGVIAVNEALAEWVRRRLHVAADRVWHVPNLVCEPETASPAPDLPGRPGARIVCVANFRPEKDHQTLLQAMARVIHVTPEAHLLLVGGRGQPVDCCQQVHDAIVRSGLPAHVSMLGPRNDVSAILRHCDVGVISSSSEGLPLALLEYGLAGLGVVSTRVGQCADVLEEGRAGQLVPASDPDALAAALLSLLGAPQRRAALAERFRRRVRELYSVNAVVKQICRIYESIL